MYLWKNAYAGINIRRNKNRKVENKTSERKGPLNLQLTVY